VIIDTFNAETIKKLLPNTDVVAGKNLGINSASSFPSARRNLLVTQYKETVARKMRRIIF
jgi:hypothetical protein